MNKIWIKKTRVFRKYKFPTQYLNMTVEQAETGALDNFLKLGWETTEDIPWYLA
jgi:hypothetical protein